MGVSRNIKVTFFSYQKNPYVLLYNFLNGFWIKSKNAKINMFYNNDSDEDVLPYEIEFQDIEDLFLLRSSKGKINTISFMVENLNEGIILSVNKLESKTNSQTHYELNINPGGGHTLKEFPRNTDFSYYLNIVLPRLKSINCQIWEIACNDIG